MKKYLLLSLAMAVSLPAYAALDCATPPTCDELGYTMSSDDCAGQFMLKCPFDNTLVFCGGEKYEVGQIKHFSADDDIPQGFVKADGYIHSPAVYPDLYTLYGLTSKGEKSQWFIIPKVTSADENNTAYVYAGTINEDAKAKHMSGCAHGNVNAPYALILVDGIYKCVYHSAATGQNLGRLVSVLTGADYKGIVRAITSGKQSTAWAACQCYEWGLENVDLSYGNIHNSSSKYTIGDYESANSSYNYSYRNTGNCSDGSTDSSYYRIMSCSGDGSSSCTITTASSSKQYRAICEESLVFAVY